MSHDKRQILVVKRDALFREFGEFQGFCPVSYKDFSNIILEEHEYQERGLMEEDPSFQQIIPYVWIINPKTKQVFAYLRAPDKRYDEARLRGKWSCGLGGHVDKKETSPSNPLESAMLRELSEEVTMPSHSKPRTVGFLNDDWDAVGKVHFGVVAVVEAAEASKGDDEMAHGQFYSVTELEEIFTNPENQVESWTKLSWPFVKRYLGVS